MHETENHGIQFYRLYFGQDWAKFKSVEKEYIANVLIAEELKHDTIITREQLELLEKNGIKLAQYSI